MPNKPLPFDHQPAPKAPVSPKRRTPYSHLYDRKWRTASKAFLLDNHFCAICSEHGITTPADCVDHIVPHRGDLDLFWDLSNWQPCCLPCNTAKRNRGM